MAYTAISGNTSATDGHLYSVTSGNPTVTLPTPTANATVGVFVANGAISGASPVTVTASSGSIASAGSLAATRTLGTPYVSVLLVADGTNWMTVAGQWDTGWVATGLPASWSTTSGYAAPATRIVGDRVLMRGNATNGTGGNANFLVTLATQFRPASRVDVACQSSSMNVNAIYVDIQTTGQLQTLGPTPNLATVGFDGVSYSLA